MALNQRLSMPVFMERYHGDCSFVGKMGQVERVGAAVLIRLSATSQKMGANSCSNGM